MRDREKDSTEEENLLNSDNCKSEDLVRLTAEAHQQQDGHCACDCPAGVQLASGWHFSQGRHTECRAQGILLKQVFFVLINLMFVIRQEHLCF